MTTKKDIYIHVGLGRTGSTFLQYRVFPKFRGIKYIQRNRFRKAPAIISRSKKNRFFVSGEMDYKQLEWHMERFSAHFKNARPIVIFRRQDGWIASQFRRYIKSGHNFCFEEFFNLENNTGSWPMERLFFYNNIETLEKYFEQKPLVLLYDDLKKDPKAFVQRIADYCGAKVDLGKINFHPKHASYNEKQLRAVYTFGKRTNLRKKKPYKSKTINVIRNLWVNAKRYTILYLAFLIPDKWISKDEIFPTRRQLDKIREFYAEDWERCKKYSLENKVDM